MEENSEYFRHATAIIEPGCIIGTKTKIWAFSHILSSARIGEYCNICDHVFIENDVVIGNRVTVKCGVQLWDSIRIGNDVFIGPNATFTNDPFPRSKKYLSAYPKTEIKDGASIGANATILPGITIGKYAMVGAGAVVTHNVPENAIVVGNPASIVGYVDSDQDFLHHRIRDDLTLPLDKEMHQLGVGEARLQRLPLIHDLRGNLSAGEYEKHIPFIPKRYFLVFDVPSRKVRGEHAHKTLEEFLVCVKGDLSVMLDDGYRRIEVRLEGPDIGLYIPPRIWGVQYKNSSDAILLVLASDFYNPDDYIRGYDEFLAYIGR